MRAVAVVSVLLAAVAVAAATDDKLLVELPGGGKLRGHLNYKSTSGRPIMSFQGIPYAAPPVGDLRFKVAREPEPWQGVLEADKQYSCTQINFITWEYEGQEDCLYINVYVPAASSTTSEGLLPVMAWIHGGGWVGGDSTTQFYGPDRYLDKNVVLVTFNYRLGPLGFLTFGDDLVPTNLGLRDQRTALKWIQKNVAAFGGDPGRVTVFGESAGSASVAFHLLSPQSEGLFGGAIMQSGVAASAFAMRDKHPSYYARSLAGKLGCDPEATNEKVLECLAKADAERLTREQNVETIIQVSPLHWTPVMDADLSSDPFIPGEPEFLIADGKFVQVPTIIGYNKDEGLLITNELMTNQETMKKFNRFVPEYLLSLIFGRSKSEVIIPEMKMMLKLMVDHLKGTKKFEPTKEDLAGVVDVISDAWFSAIGTRTARKMSEKSSAPVYEYLYQHQGTTSLLDFQMNPSWKIMLKALGRKIGLNLFPLDLGVNHADELFLQFKSAGIPWETAFNDADRAASENLIELWTNFAAHWDPTPGDAGVGGVKWERLDAKNPQKLNISSTLEFGPPGEGEAARLENWESIWREFPPRMSTKRHLSWKEGARSYSKQEVKKARDEL